MTTPNRIDVHQHLVPPKYAEWLRTKGIADAGGRALPKWTAASALAMMDEIGTATGILSVSAPGTGPAADESEAVRIAREVNDFALFPRLATQPIVTPPRSLIADARRTVRARVVRAAVKFVDPTS